jgi:hypothetical protein
MKKLASFFLAIVFFLSLIQQVRAEERFWPVQSIDTMKFSRDASRQQLSQDFIDQQIKNIADTGANYVAIDTPYDSEFLPRLREWVEAARKYNLNVWFRGNWSGWEGWFNYPKDLTRQDHLNKTRDFILQNPDLFQNGDIFTACPECENGGPGDPRSTGDVEGFRQFMVNEYQITNQAFLQINKQVNSNYDSMNGDVASLIMNPLTTSDLGGIVTVDHYTSTPDKLASKIINLASTSAGKIVLGEFGIPIPEINGSMTDSQQADWLSTALSNLINQPQLIGLNYWVNVGGSTALWNDDGSPRSAVAVLTKFYKHEQINGIVTDELGGRISNPQIVYLDHKYSGDDHGNFQLPYLSDQTKITFSADNHKTITLTVKDLPVNKQVVLEKISRNWWNYIDSIWLKIKKFLF